MTRSDRAIREVEERLAAGPRPVPPRDLLQHLVDEIPEDLVADAADRGSSTPWWKLAAVVVLVVGGGLLGRQMLRETPTAGEFVEQEMERAERERTSASEEADAAPESGVQAEHETLAEAAPDTAEERSPLASAPEPGGLAAPTPAPTPATTEAVDPAAGRIGDLHVRVSDPHGYVLPGVTVTLYGDGAPRIRVTDNAGRVRFLGVPAGRWSMRCEREGFSTVDYPGVEVWADGSRTVEVMLPEAVEQVVTVTAESPLQDERKLTPGTNSEGEQLQKIPSAPEPWSVRGQTPGVAVDRVEVGGAEEGSEPAAPRRAERLEIRGRLGAVSPKMVPPPPSTGGTAEPNDQPYGDMFFGSYGENPFIDTEDDALSTFGLDVDTGSWTLVRSYVDRGHLPPRDAVRVEELVNAFDYGDAAPRRGDFELVAEGARTPYGESAGYHLLRFGLRARDVLRRERPPVVLVFTVDTSGSMAREDRLGLVKRSLELLVEELGPRDEVGLVTFGSRARVVLEPTSDRGELLRSLSRLRPDGSTNAEQGLRMAYDLIQRYRREGSIHRVILCSDGVANVGATGPDSILESIGRWAREGIELTTIGFGMGNYNDLLMEQLADRGDGRYHYVDTLEEARRVFVDDLAGTLVTVAEEARAQVEFDPAAVERYRLLGYENRDIADRDFRNARIDAGEIGAGHHVTALYEVKLREGLRARDVVATLRLRYRSAETEEWIELAHDLTAGELADRWERAPHALRLAGTVAELAELLKGTYWARGGELDALSREAEALARESRGDAEVAELARVARRAAELAREPGPAREE